MHFRGPEVDVDDNNGGDDGAAKDQHGKGEEGSDDWDASRRGRGDLTDHSEEHGHGKKVSDL